MHADDKRHKIKDYQACQCSRTSANARVSGLSRRKQGFDSPWGRQFISCNTNLSVGQKMAAGFACVRIYSDDLFDWQRAAPLRLPCRPVVRKIVAPQWYGAPTIYNARDAREEVIARNHQRGRASKGVRVV
jgi:hypothetical protein